MGVFCLRQNRQSCILAAKAKTLDGGEGSLPQSGGEHPTGAAVIVARLRRQVKGGVQT